MASVYCSLRSVDVFYIGTVKQIGTAHTFCLLDSPSQITWAPIAYTLHPQPHPHRQYAGRKSGDRSRKRRSRAGGLLSFSQHCGFHSSRLSPDRKAGQKVGCAGKVRISLGWAVHSTQYSTYAQPPLCIVLHTHANIFIVDTKPSLYQGPFVF